MVHKICNLLFSIYIYIQVEKQDPKSFLNLFKTLVKLRDEPSVLVGLLLFPLVNEYVFSFLRFLVGSRCFLLLINTSSKCIHVDMSHTSDLLPREGFLELSNGHLPEINTDFDKLVIDECKCQHNSESVHSNVAGSSRNKKLKILFNNIHLRGKEAVVLSFTGEERQ